MNDFYFENAFSAVPDAVHRRLEKALEEKSMKLNKAKKSVAVLVLALALLLGLMGIAYAAAQSGILNFAKEHGEKAEPAYLIDELEKSAYNLKDPRFRYDRSKGYMWAMSESELVNVELEELLFEEGWLYAAMTVTPCQPKTMVIGTDLVMEREGTGTAQLHLLGGLTDITEPGSMKAYVPEGNEAGILSVYEYAQQMGFEKVVRVAVSREMKYADYELREDGSLRMVVQMKEYREKAEFSEHIRMVSLLLTAVQYDEKGRMPEDYDKHEMVEVQFIGPEFVDARTKVSISEDSHYLKGFHITMDQVIMVPASETEMSIILRIKEDTHGLDLRQLNGPVAMILSETGEVLYEYVLEWENVDQDAMLYYDGVQFRFTMPREGLADDRITIRLHDAQNRKIVYDKYTYTLK